MDYLITILPLGVTFLLKCATTGNFIFFDQKVKFSLQIPSSLMKGSEFQLKSFVNAPIDKNIDHTHINHQFCQIHGSSNRTYFYSLRLLK